MSAGDLVVVEHLGTMECYTPACSYHYKSHADVVRIGRLVLQVCQHCLGHKPLHEPWPTPETTP